MKKVLMLSIILVLCIAGGAFAAPVAKSGAGLTIDGSISVADETYKGSDAGFGFGFGVSYDLSDMVRLGDSKFLARADFNYYQGEQDAFFATLDSSRIPFFVGARYVLPIKTQPLDVFAEAGIELSFDKYETIFPFGPFAGLKDEVSDTNLGLVPGIGVTFPIGDSLSIGANARVHVITNNYVSFSFSLGYSF